MYYIRLDGENSNKLIYYCRNCGNEDDTLIATLDNICVSKTTVKKKEGGVKHLVNEYTKLDPTLPRVSNIPCPNAACISNRDHGAKEDGEDELPHEVIYLRYNDAQLKFVYICNLCDSVWKSAETN
jgi:DNA-directed RNA polymerase subunit M/transcription elongation factor TFIIS|tara:strand:+ start:883 stop:1260 length:378 start_codon:yes stop_codon:yes gene_type:complete